MKMDATTTKIVDFCELLRFEDVPSVALEATKARILSALAVSLAGFALEPVRIARGLAQPVAGGFQSSIFGEGTKTAPDFAAFVNSAMIRALDMSDTYVMAAVSHPADAFPSILAVAEALGTPGRDVLLATVLAYEIQCRFVEVVPYNHNGWDQTPVVALGAAVGAGRLLGLSREQLAHAISLAICPNIALNQTRTGSLSMWKGMAGPQGARAGVFAALLARAGMTGPDGVFEGQYGFWNQLMEGKSFDLPLPSQLGGHTFAVQQTMIKSFPTRFNCQVPVFAALELRETVEVKDIESLKIESIRQAFERWLDSKEVWKPQTRETADHSLPCTVSMALLDGKITPRMMDEERYKQPDVLELMTRCSIELPDDIAAAAPETRICRLTAVLKNGETRRVEHRRTLKDDAADTGWRQSVRKLNDLTADILDEPARERLIAAVQDLEDREGVGRLVASTLLRT